MPTVESMREKKMGRLYRAGRGRRLLNGERRYDSWKINLAEEIQSRCRGGQRSRVGCAHERESDLSGTVLREVPPRPVAIENRGMDRNPMVDKVLLGRERDRGAILRQRVAQRTLCAEEDAFAGKCRQGEPVDGEIERRREQLKWCRCGNSEGCSSD
jgi:hypothetical protein